MTLKEKNNVLRLALDSINYIVSENAGNNPDPEDVEKQYDCNKLALDAIAKVLADAMRLEVFDGDIPKNTYFSPEAVREFAKAQKDIMDGKSLDAILANPPTGGEKKDVLHIGCIPAKYLKVDGAWAAIAFNAAQQMYNVRVSGKKGKVVATFSIDGETKFTLEAGSFARAIQLACSASNAYIHMNRRAMERRHRRKANARAAAENKEPTDEKAKADMQQVSEVAR